jgi:protein-tyrosine phosphatase
MFLFKNREQTCVRIPLDVKGRLYVSPMPFGPYDPGNALLKVYKSHHVQFVVMLVTDVELAAKAKRDVLGIYKKSGMEPIRFPFADYTSPDLHAISKVVDRVSGYLRAGANVAIHCNAGVGRTGVMTCCVVRDIMKIPAQEAIDYVKQHMQTKMTDEQMRLVGKFNTLAEEVEERKYTDS